jgi:hypothetical protein
MPQLFCAWLPHSDMKLCEVIVTRFAPTVAAKLCFPGRILPKLLTDYRQHFKDLPNSWLAPPRT